MTSAYLELPLADFLGQVAAPTPAPGAGAVAATVAALAAGLTAMAAGLSHRQLPEAEELVARAQRLRERAEPLAQQDAEAYAEVLAARRLPRDDPGRSATLDAALSAATDVPLEIAGVGVAVLELASDVVRRGNPNLRGDALTACLLAQAAVRSAVVLVGLNLAEHPGDPRLARTVEMLATVRRVARSTPLLAAECD